MKVLLFGILFVVLLLAGCAQPSTTNPEPVVDCNQFEVQSCPVSCAICPPCEACSSIRCETETVCQQLGFDKNWYETVRPR